jgi:hypothetical protein
MSGSWGITPEEQPEFNEINKRESQDWDYKKVLPKKYYTLLFILQRKNAGREQIRKHIVREKRQSRNHNTQQATIAECVEHGFIDGAARCAG